MIFSGIIGIIQFKGKNEMKFRMYVDESGNTGEPQIRKGKWNYGDQRYFGLGSIMVKEEDEKELSNKTLEVLQKYDPKLGTENELKSQGKYLFKIELLCDLINLFQDYDYFAFFDISNKKFKVICYMVEYCVYPYYIYAQLLTQEKHRTKRINAANALYYNLDESQIERFDCLIRKKNEELDKRKDFLDFLEVLMNELYQKKQKELVEGIGSAINFIKDSPGMPLSNLIPVEDYNNSGKSNFFLPNIDALNNIVAQQAIKRLSYNDAISIIHDEQLQFSNSLTKWIDYQRDQGLKVQIDAFMDSKNSVILQTTDFFLGMIIRLFQKIIERRPLSRNDREAMKILKPLVSSANSNCNIVSVQSEQAEFFRAFGVKAVRTTIPYRLY